MTKTEIARRLTEMDAGLIIKIDELIRGGYGAQGIEQNSPATLKQANAVFAARKAPDWSERVEQYKREDEADAKEWADSCAAMRKAEGDHYDGYDPEAQADLAAPTYAELMGLEE